MVLISPSVMPSKRAFLPAFQVDFSLPLTFLIISSDKTGSLESSYKVNSPHAKVAMVDRIRIVVNVRCMVVSLLRLSVLQVREDSSRRQSALHASEARMKRWGKVNIYNNNINTTRKGYPERGENAKIIIILLMMVCIEIALKKHLSLYAMLYTC